MLLSLIQLGGRVHTRFWKRHRDPPVLFTLPPPFPGFSTSHPKSNLNYCSFSNLPERKTGSKEQRQSSVIRWIVCGQAQSRRPWRAPWRPCCRSRGRSMGVRMRVCGPGPQRLPSPWAAGKREGSPPLQRPGALPSKVGTRSLLTHIKNWRKGRKCMPETGS